MGAGLICSGYIFVLGSLHLETVHSLAGLGNVQLVVVRVAHFSSLLLIDSGKSGTFRMESVFSFRGHSLTKVEKDMSGEWRKDWERM